MKYIGNLELQLEYLGSKIINGLILPIEYIDINTYFCKLELLNIDNKISSLLSEIQKMILTPFGLLKESQIDNYFYGKNENLIELLMILKPEIDRWIPIYETAFLERQQREYDELEQNMTGQDFVGIGQAIDIAHSKIEEIKDIKNTETQIRIFQGLLDALIPLYGSSLRKLPKKTIKVSIDPEYQIFINDLFNNPEISAGNIDLAIVLGRLIQSIQAVFPKTQILDPYATQISNNILNVLSKPEDYYKDCKSDIVLNDTVGTLYENCYPAFYNKFLDMYLDEYENMDYSDQIVFRKCFAIPEDNSQLLALTNTYIKVGYTT